jgi:hypothetical protein
VRPLATLLFILSSFQLFAQENYPRVNKVVVEDKLFHGQIDEYPITIYLKFNHYSNYHLGVYSVEGWYYYDKVKTKIPLVGLYNYPELTLYNFQDTSRSSELLTFREMKSTHWDDMKYYQNLEGYQEKFVFTKDGNAWTNRNKELKVSVSEDDLSIKKVYEFLYLDSVNSFDLHNFGGWTWNFQIIAQKEGKFILEYSHGSRLYFMGQCGAGTENGFLKLDFDENNMLLKYEEFTYESCNNSISEEEREQVSANVTVYHCYDYNNETSFDLIVDVEELSITKKEKY